MAWAADARAGGTAVPFGDNLDGRRLGSPALAWACAGWLGVVAGPTGLHAAAPDGGEIYRQACAACHESGENRAPSLEALQRLSREAILESLGRGTMASVGATLPDGHAEAVAAYLAGAEEPRTAPQPHNCPAAPWVDPFAGPRWNGWGADLANSRFQPAESARLDADKVPLLRLRWAFGFPDSDRARAHPTVAGGRVYLGARSGLLYALDAKSGCRIWEFRARAEVRTAVVLSRPEGEAGRVMAYFGDVRGNVYGIDASTGREIWRTLGDEHPAVNVTGSPVLHEGTLYVPLSSGEEFTGSFPTYSCCVFRGSVVALDSANGERLWKTHTIPEEPRPTWTNNRSVQQYGPSGAGIWSAPTIDERLGRLYVATGDNYSDPPTDDSDAIIAFDLATGERLWSQQFTAGDAFNMACGSRRDPANCPEAQGPDYDFGSSPILVELAGGQRLLVAGQKSGMVHAVDPDRDGAIVWQRRAGAGGVLGGIQFGPAADGRHVYAAVADIAFGPQMGRKGGGITAFRLADGERVWHTPGYPCPPARKGCSPAQSAAVTAIPGVVFSGSLDGFLRAYSAEDGSLVWGYDTVRDYPDTVNGVPAQGGSLNGPGPAVVDGMVYVNSGYGQFGSIAGNAFLAFGVD